MSTKSEMMEFKAFESVTVRQSFVMLIALAVLAGSCGNSKPQPVAGLVVINAPASGTVRAVLAGEGTAVSADAPLIEIVATPSQGTTNSEQDRQLEAVRNALITSKGPDLARKEVVRTESEVQRLTSLVASGQAQQTDLDAAKADYDRAQLNLQEAQTAAANARDALASANQSSPPTDTATRPGEQIAIAKAPAAGILSAINVRPGDHVAAGQPLATLAVSSSR